MLFTHEEPESVPNMFQLKTGPDERFLEERVVD